MNLVESDKAHLSWQKLEAQRTRICVCVFHLHLLLQFRTYGVNGLTYQYSSYTLKRVSFAEGLVRLLNDV